MPRKCSIAVVASVLSLALGFLSVPARAATSFNDLEVSVNIRGSSNLRVAKTPFLAAPVGYVELDGDCETTVVDKSTSSLSECAARCEHFAECVGFSFESGSLCYIKSKTCVKPTVSSSSFIFFAKTSSCTHCYGVAANGTVQDTKGSCYLSPLNPSDCMMNGFVCSKTFDSDSYSKCTTLATPERPDPEDFGAPPIIGDYDPDEVVHWDEVSAVPHWVSSLLAISWITMVAGMPLLAMALEGKKITKIQLASFAIMWIVFLGGLYMFTNVILFQSIHFKRIRSLTTVEAVYLLSQILTTVGYGDITPAKPLGQFCVAIYVLLSLVVIANVTSQVSNLVAANADKIESYVSQRLGGGQPQEIVDVAEVDPKESEEIASSREMDTNFKQEAQPKVDLSRLQKMMTIYAFFVAIGVLFFSCYPGEGKTWVQGIYMSVITLSTVGFGAFTPATEAGKVFGAFWMLWGSMALVGVVSAFAEVHEMRKRSERWNPNEAVDQKRNVVAAVPDTFEQLDLLKQYVLTRGLMKEAEVEDLETLFRDLRPDHNGKIHKSALSEFLNQEKGIVPQVAG